MSGWGYQTRRGEEHPRAKLNADSKAAIKARRAKGDTYDEIAHDLGVSKNTVRDYDQGRSHRDE